MAQSSPVVLTEVRHVEAAWTTDTPSGAANSVFVTTYLDEMLALVDPSADARLGEVVSGLTGWDHLQVDLDQTGYYDDPYGTIFNAWWFALADGVFDEVSGISNRFVVGNLVDRMLAGADAGRPLQYGYLEGATPAEAVTGALIAAQDGLTADYGSADMSAWMQPISVINWAPLPLSPGLPPTIWMNRGTYNQIVHLRGNVTAQNVISPGQSGDPASPQFLATVDTGESVYNMALASDARRAPSPERRARRGRPPGPRAPPPPAPRAARGPAPRPP